MEVLMKIMKFARVYDTENYACLLSVKASDGRWINYGMSETAPRSGSRRRYIGLAARRAYRFSGRLWLHGGSRALEYNKWREDADFHLWRKAK